MPLQIKKKAEAKEVLFRKNPFQANLRTHKLKGRLKNYWVFSIDQHYRIVFAFVSKNKVRFHTIGLHNIYYQNL